MEIGRPINLRHVAHVTFDKFIGFLGLPVDLETQVRRRPSSASATVFGICTEFIQMSYNSRGNSVPTVLLLMQRHLHAQGGLQVQHSHNWLREDSESVRGIVKKKMFGTK